MIKKGICRMKSPRPTGMITGLLEPLHEFSWEYAALDKYCECVPTSVWNMNKNVLKLRVVGRCGGDRKDMVSLSFACQAGLGCFYCMAPAC